MDILKKLREEFGITQSQAENTVRLLDEGNTVPFIARYRQEMTGSLDDQIIRQLSERLTALRNLEDRRTQVRTAIAEQGRLTDALAAKLDAAQTQTEIEDIYRPFRPKRRTRASLGPTAFSGYYLGAEADWYAGGSGKSLCGQWTGSGHRFGRNKWRNGHPCGTDFG